MTPAALLDALAAEEAALADTAAGLDRLAAALRSGVPDAILAATAAADQLAAANADLAAARRAAADQLAAALGLPADSPLTAFAAALPDHAAAFIAGRGRLTLLAAEVRAGERRNANLVRHLRSYFRGVMAVLAAADAPARYGPTGATLAPAAGGALLARG